MRLKSLNLLEVKALSISNNTPIYTQIWRDSNPTPSRMPRT